MAEVLAIDLIRLDGGTQLRAAVNEEAVSDYADVWQANGRDYPFDKPCDVFFDGSEYWCADGFHRILGGLRAKRASVLCNVHKGTVRDAILFAARCNTANGLRRTNEDKRYAVTLLLKDSEWGQKSSRWLAEAVGVSHTFVETLRLEQNQLATVANRQTNVRDGKDNRKRKSGKKKGPKKDYGKCPNCASTKWTEDENGVACAKCHHPHGEPVGDVDDSRIGIQRSKTVKTVEAMMRAFDDLNLLSRSSQHGGAIDACKALLKLAREWK